MRRIILIFILVASFGSSAGVAAQATPVAESAVTVCGQAEAGTPEAFPAAQSGAPTDPGALEFDVIFLDAMIPHMETAVFMAVVARNNNARPAIYEFAQGIIDVQRRQVDSMRTWRAEWYPDIPPLTQQQLVEAMFRALSDSPGMGGAAGLEGMDQAQHKQALATLCSSKADIDLTYIDLMVAHNSSSIVLAREAENRANHREIREMAQSIIATQQFEIDQLSAWREAWFPGTPVSER